MKTRPMPGTRISSWAVSLWRLIVCACSGSPASSGRSWADSAGPSRTGRCGCPTWPGPWPFSLDHRGRLEGVLLQDVLLQASGRPTQELLAVGQVVDLGVGDGDLVPFLEGLPQRHAALVPVALDVELAVLTGED